MFLQIVLHILMRGIIIQAHLVKRTPDCPTYDIANMNNTCVKYTASQLCTLVVSPVQSHMKKSRRHGHADLRTPAWIKPAIETPID